MRAQLYMLKGLESIALRWMEHQQRQFMESTGPRDRASTAGRIRLLAKWRHRYERPDDRAVGLRADPLEGPSFVGLQVVVVMTEERQVVGKSLIRPLAKCP